MHHMTKKSLITKYEKVASAGGTAIEVKNAITQGEPGLSLEEVDELVLAIFDNEEKAEDQSGTTQPGATTHPAPVAAAPISDKPDFTKGKKRYDILRGKWHARKYVTGFDGKDLVVLWEFEQEGKPMKTGVPMEPEKAEQFNVTKRLRAGNVFTEQMREVGSTEKMFDHVDNPYTVKEITI